MDIIIFRKVFKNKIIKQLIFKQVNHIFNIFKRKSFKWNQVEDSPNLLAGNGYFDKLKHYYQRNNITKIYAKGSPIINIIRTKRLDMLIYLIDELHFNYQSKFDFRSYIYTQDQVERCCDLLFIATFFGSFEIIKYLDTLDSDHNIYNSKSIWDYSNALLVAPNSKDLEIVKYIYSKIDIHALDRNKMYFCIQESLKLGRIDIFEWLESNSSNMCNSLKLAYACVNSGKIEVLQYYLSKPEHYQKDVNELLIDFVLDYEQYDMIKWLHENKIGKASTEVLDEVARHSLDLLKWFIDNRTEKMTEKAMDYAALHGHLDIILWLHHNRTEGCTTQAMDYAAKTGNLEIVKWLHENRTEGCTSWAMNLAAEKGHLEIVKFLHFNRGEGCTTRAMELAAERGKLEMVKWLHHNRSEGCTKDAMDNAAYCNQNDVVKWLNENRTEGCSTHGFSNAAATGNLELLKYMHSCNLSGFRNASTLAAANRGQLEVLKWMHENNIYWLPRDVMAYAITNGHFDIVKWISENRPEVFTSDNFNSAVQYGELQIVKLLFEKYHSGIIDENSIKKLVISQVNMETIEC